jgi:hypothetical protein
MSKKLASLLLRISANGAEAQQVLRTLSQDVTTFAKKAERVGRTLTTHITLPLAAAAGAAVTLANTQLQAEAKLLNALNGRSDVQQRLIAQAGELQSRSTIGDEEIIAQQAYLAELGLTEKQISATMNAAVQLSAALGISLEAAVKNLAKTFGGMTGELGESIPALKSFTKEQLMAGEAIDFVNENYKGFAETAASTGTGALLQLKNSLGDLGEQIGVIILPAVQKLAEQAKDLVSWLQQLPDATKTWVVELGALAAVLGPLTIAFGKITGFLSKIKGALPTIIAGFQQISPFMAGLGSQVSPEEWMGKDRYESYQAIAGMDLTATSVAQMLRKKYIPAVEAATEANEELVESNEDVTLSAPKPKITPVSGIATDSRNLGGLSGGIALDKEALATQIADVSAFALGLAKMRQEAENIAETGIDIANILQNAFQGIASGISNAVTALIEGVDFKPLAAFVNLLGDALQQLGEALVSYAGAQIAAKTALVSMQWPVALAAGAAAIAAGAALKSLVKKKLEVPALASGGLAYAPTLAVVGDNRGAASDPEVIAPLSKLRQYMGGPSLELAGNVTLRVDGYDLVAVLNRTNTHLKYRG